MVLSICNIMYGNGSLFPNCSEVVYLSTTIDLKTRRGSYIIWDALGSWSHPRLPY